MDSLIVPVLKVKKDMCKDLVHQTDTNLVIAFCRLMDAFAADPRNGLNEDEKKKNDAWYNNYETWFTFALIWSLGATVDELGRK